MTTSQPKDFFFKENTHNTQVLQTYNDGALKVVTQLKKNTKTILAKAYPTSKSCSKYLLNAWLEIDNEHVVLLLNVLTKIRVHTSQVFVIVAETSNWRKERLRLIVRSSAYNGLEVLYQKYLEELPDNDVIFDEDRDGDETSMPITPPRDSWEDEYQTFQIRKADVMHDIVAGLRKYVGKPAKLRQKRKVDDYEEEEEDGKKLKIVEQDIACESIDLNRHALIELMYYSEMCGMDIEDTIYGWHEKMNANLN